MIQRFELFLQQERRKIIVPPAMFMNGYIYTYGRNMERREEHMGDEILYPFDKLDASKSRGREALELEGGTRKQPTNTPVILGADWKRRIRGEIEKFTPDSLLPRTRRRDGKKGKLSAAT